MAVFKHIIQSTVFGDLVTDTTQTPEELDSGVMVWLCGKSLLHYKRWSEDQWAFKSRESVS